MQDLLVHKQAPVSMVLESVLYARLWGRFEYLKVANGTNWTLCVDLEVHIIHIMWNYGLTGTTPTPVSGTSLWIFCINAWIYIVIVERNIGVLHADDGYLPASEWSYIFWSILHCVSMFTSEQLTVGDKGWLWPILNRLLIEHRKVAWVGAILIWVTSTTQVAQVQYWSFQGQYAGLYERRWYFVAMRDA